MLVTAKMNLLRIRRACGEYVLPPTGQMEPKCTLYGSNASVMSVQFDNHVCAVFLSFCIIIC